jgi:hypothetical protein
LGVRVKAATQCCWKRSGELASQLEILQAKRFGAGYEIFADGASAAHYAETYPELVMFVEEGAGF